MLLRQRADRKSVVNNNGYGNQENCCMQTAPLYHHAAQQLAVTRRNCITALQHDNPTTPCTQPHALERRGQFMLHQTWPCSLAAHQVHNALRVDVGQRAGHFVSSQRHAAQVRAAVRGLAAGAEPALDHGVLQGGKEQE